MSHASPRSWRYDGTAGERRAVRRDPVRLDVVGVAVAAELVVRDEHLRAHLTDDLDQEVRRLGEVGVPERVVAGLVERRGVAVSAPLHAGVAVVERAAEEAVVGDAEDLHRGRELLDAVRAEPVLLVGRRGARSRASGSRPPRRPCR